MTRSRPASNSAPPLQPLPLGTELLPEGEDAAGADAAQAPDHEERRRFHLHREHAGALQQRRARRGRFGVPAPGVVGIGGFDQPEVGALAARRRRLAQGLDDVEVGDSGISGFDVGVRGALAAERGGGDDGVAAPGARGDGTGGADADDGVDAGAAQLFHRDGHGRATHARRHHRHRRAVQRPSHRAVFTVLRHPSRLLQMAGDAFHALPVAGQEHVAPRPRRAARGCDNEDPQA